ncbi:hypothetical protein HYW18_02000 [Candidatus Uhrbacteria bacterium]|nr:hypothetical protein [Candidatus Uhrbacteria bacterium]
MPDSTVVVADDPHFDALTKMLEKRLKVQVHFLLDSEAFAGVEVTAIYSKPLGRGWVVEESPEDAPEWARGAKRRIAVNAWRFEEPKGLYQNLRRVLGLERVRANTGTYAVIRRGTRRAANSGRHWGACSV